MTSTAATPIHRLCIADLTFPIRGLTVLRATDALLGWKALAGPYHGREMAMLRRTIADLAGATAALREEADGITVYRSIYEMKDTGDDDRARQPARVQRPGDFYFSET